MEEKEKIIEEKRLYDDLVMLSKRALDNEKIRIKEHEKYSFYKTIVKVIGISLTVIIVAAMVCFSAPTTQQNITQQTSVEGDVKYNGK